MSRTTTPNGFLVRTADRLPVSHPALTSIPFQRTIESWVRAHFPDAAYAEVGAAEVAPSHLDLSLPGTWVVQAPKGSGKSKAIRRAIAEQVPPHHTVLQVTFRRALAWAAASLTGPAGVTYLEVEDGTPLSARDFPRLTVVVNSITRVRGPYDVLVVDELVSVLDMLASELLQPELRVKAVAALVDLLAAARTVVVADAMLDATCLQFLTLARAGGALRVLDFPTRNHGDYTYYPHAEVGTWLAALDAAVDAGRKVVVPCMTKAQAVKVAARYADRVPVQLYTADTPPEDLRTAMATLDTRWAAASVLVYSPVITAGCSFERRHFDVAFFYGCAGVGSVRSAIQMVARVRDIASRAVHVFIAHADYYGPVVGGDHLTPPGPPASTTGDPRRDRFLWALDTLDAHRRGEDACARQAFPYYFWSLVVHSGAAVGFLGAASPGGPPTAAQDEDEQEEEDPAATASTAAAQPGWEGARAPGLGWWWGAPGSLWHRATTTPPDCLHDLGLLPRRGVHLLALGPPGPSGPTAFQWVGGAAGAPQARLWAGLVARKAACAMLATARSTLTWRPVPRLARGTAALAPPPAARCGLTWFKHPDVGRVLGEAAAIYSSSRTTWVDALVPAWRLAGAELARRANTQPDPAGVLEEASAASAAVQDAVWLTDRVNTALLHLKPVALHCGYAWGATAYEGPDAPSPNRPEAALALVDFGVVDAQGRLHLVHVNLDGSPDRDGVADVAALAVVAAAAHPVASVAVFYVLANTCARWGVPGGPPPDRLLALATQPPPACGLGGPWDCTVHTGYVWAGAGGVHLWWPGAPPPGVRCVNPSQVGAATAAAALDVRKWVAWGLVAWLDCADEPTPAAALGFTHVADLEVFVRAAVTGGGGGGGGGVLDMFQTAPAKSEAAAAPPPDGLGPELAHLRRLHVAASTHQFLVCFWDGRPRGLAVRALPMLDSFVAEEEEEEEEED